MVSEIPRIFRGRAKGPRLWAMEDSLEDDATTEEEEGNGQAPKKDFAALRWKYLGEVFFPSVAFADMR